MAEGPAPADASLRRCIDHYLATLGEPSRRTREQTLEVFASHAGKLRASAMKKRHVLLFLKPDWTASTRRSHIKTILACLNRAVKDGLLCRNPVADVEKPAWKGGSAS